MGNPELEIKLWPHISHQRLPTDSELFTMRTSFLAFLPRSLCLIHILQAKFGMIQKCRRTRHVELRNSNVPNHCCQLNGLHQTTTSSIIRESLFPLFKTRSLMNDIFNKSLGYFFGFIFIFYLILWEQQNLLFERTHLSLWKFLLRFILWSRT